MANVDNNFNDIDFNLISPDGNIITGSFGGHFRDYARITPDTTNASNITSLGDPLISTDAPGVSGTVPMLLEDSTTITINGAYTDITKNFWELAKFIDKYIIISLICDNSDKNLVTLYSLDTRKRLSYR